MDNIPGFIQTLQFRPKYRFYIHVIVTISDDAWAADDSINCRNGAHHDWMFTAWNIKTFRYVYTMASAIKTETNL